MLQANADVERRVFCERFQYIEGFALVRSETRGIGRPVRSVDQDPEKMSSEVAILFGEHRKLTKR